jgi:hypothetical protein
MDTPAPPAAGNCARCGVYCDTFPTRVGNQGFCSSCSTLFQNWPYPQWLKLSLALLLLLLVVALLHGRTYFHAGRVMYIGERFVNQRRYTEALPYLKEALRVAPRSDKAVLLTAKAALLTGDMQTADSALQGHDHGKFEDANKPEFREVNALWNRAESAITKAVQASKLEDQDGNEVEAARLMHEAASMYPEMKSLALAAKVYDAGTAFARQDYDSFLATSELVWKEQPAPNTAAGVASALACEYAVTGDPAYRQQSEDMLAKARQLAQNNAETNKFLDEFTERNKYRLDSRQIITRHEFDRRFRGGKSPVE